MCPLCDKFMTNHGRQKSSPTPDASRGIRAMGFSNTFKHGREIGLEQDHTDSVTTWILGLAIGMIVLGTAFAVLDWCDFFPHVAAPHVATNQAAL
jgi:hypothetical protein